MTIQNPDDVEPEVSLLAEVEQQEDEIEEDDEDIELEVEQGLPVITAMRSSSI